jgi:glucose/arabinose dehydrogenase
MKSAAVCTFLVLLFTFAIVGCEVPPLQVTAQPRTQIQDAPKDLPKIPPPNPAAAQVPQGYRVDIVATDLVYPTSVEFDRGGNMFIAEGGYVYGDHAAPARIWRVSQDGEMKIIADQLNGPITDLLYFKDRLYISHKGKISAIDNDGAVKDLVTDLPSYGDHFNNQLAAGPDGKIYFGQGVATNSGVVGVDNFVFGWLGKNPAVHDVPAHDIKVKKKDFITLDPMVLTSKKEPPLVRTAPFQAFGRGAKLETIKGAVKSNGTILRMDTDGSNLQVFAWGLRNPFGLAFTKDGNLYASDNGYDERGSRPIGNAPDCLWLIRENAWYGFPDFAGGIPVTDARFKPKSGPTPDFIMAEHPKVEKPIALRPHQAGVTKLAVSPGGSFGFDGQLFLAEVGDMSPITGNDHPMGYDVVRVNPADGKAELFFQAKRENLGEKNMEYVTTAGPKRLVDVQFSPDGDALYVVDIGAIAVVPALTPAIQPFAGTGVIWRISKEGSSPKGPMKISPLRGAPPDRPSDQKDLSPPRTPNTK